MRKLKKIAPHFHQLLRKLQLVEQLLQIVHVQLLEAKVTAGIIATTKLMRYFTRLNDNTNYDRIKEIKMWYKVWNRIRKKQFVLLINCVHDKVCARSHGIIYTTNS